MTSSVATIAEQVRDRVRREGTDLAADPALVGRLVRDEVRRYSELALGGTVPLLRDEVETTRQVVASLTGLGPLQPFLDDPEIEEIWINAPDRVFVARNGVPEHSSLRLGDGEVRDLVERMLQSTGRRVDVSSPFVDASLPDGSRLHVVIPDVATRWMQASRCPLMRPVRTVGRALRSIDRLEPHAPLRRTCPCDPSAARGVQLYEHSLQRHRRGASGRAA